jgi:hypothetical protein
MCERNRRERREREPRALATAVRRLRKTEAALNDTEFQLARSRTTMAEVEVALRAERVSI